MKNIFIKNNKNLNNLKYFINYEILFVFVYKCIHELNLL